MASSTVPGSCLCGAVRFEIELPTRACVHCHCSMCRRGHGAGYVTWFVVPRERFRLKSEPGVLRQYTSSDHGMRSFCGTCGSSLFCESSRHPDDIDIVLANMQAPIDLEPQLHVYYSDRIDWMPVDEALPRLGGSSGVEPLD